MSYFEAVAKWIYEESDQPICEIAWLLEIVYTDKSPKLAFKEAWGDVLIILKKREEI